MMDLAFLIAILLATALGVYSLRVAADRDRWRDQAEGRQDVEIVYGRIASPTQRMEAALELGRLKKKRRK